MVTRESFVSGGEGMRGLLGRWQTRIGIALIMVCMSLVLCFGVKVLCIRFHLGGIRAFLPEVLGVSTFVVVVLIGSVPLVVVQVIRVLIFMVVCLLDILHFVINMSFEKVAALSLRGATDHVFPFVVLVLLQQDVRWLPVVVIALIGIVGWIWLTPLLSRWLDTGLTLFVLTQVLSRLLVLALGFDCAYGRLRGLLVDRLQSLAAYFWRSKVALQPHPGGVKRVHHFRGRWTRMSDQGK
jgi:hypothetical protein